MVRLASILAFTASALLARADYGGVGTIHVWNSSDFRNASPADKVGCLDSHGKFLNPGSDADCGVFTRMPDYPHTLSTLAGNCTFNDESQETNTDSHYGASDHAWNCLQPFNAEIIDELYTINGLPYLFLCTGDIDCYYDAKRIPEKGQKGSLWPYRWGSQQEGITPGHVMLQLVWNQIGGLPKRGGVEDVVAREISLRRSGARGSLLGPKILS